MAATRHGLASLSTLAIALGGAVPAAAQPVPPFPPPPPVSSPPVLLQPAPAPDVVVQAPAPPVVVVSSGASAHYEDGFSLPFRALVEGQLGWSMMDPAVDGHTAALGLSLELDALEWLAFGLHGHASWRNALAPDTNLDGLADRPGIPVSALTLTAGPRFRILTASESRDHIGLELGAGLLWVPEQTRPWGAVLDVALYGGIDLRDPGGSASSDGFVLAPVVRYQQGLADAGSYRAVLVGLAGGFEFGTAPRRGRGGLGGPHYTLGVDFGLGGGFLRQATVHEGVAVDLGLRMGLVLGEVFEPTVRVDFLHRGAGVDREGLDVYGAAGGFRVLFDPWAPLYLEALVGWGVRNGTPAPLVTGGLFLDAGAGLRWLDCGDSVVAVTLGVRARVGLIEADALTSLLGVVGVELDGGPRPDRPRCEAPPPMVIDAPPPPTEYVAVAPPPIPAPHVEVAPVEVAPVQVAPVEVAPVEARPAPPPPPTTAQTRVETEIETAPRVPAGPSRIPLSLEPMLLVGVADSDRRMDGFVSGASIALGVAPIDEMVLLLRFTGLGGADEARDELPPLVVDDEEGPGFGAYLLGGDVRFRLFTDRGERNGWTFELGGGWLTIDAPPEASRPAGWLHGGYLEAAIGHQRGVRFADGFAFQFEASLRYQQGLGDAFDYRALLLAGSIMLEADTQGGEASSRHADFAYTLGAHAHGGTSFYRFSETGLQGMGGFGFHFGLPIGRWFEPRVAADLHFIPNGVERSTSPLLAFLGVLRLRLDEVAPMYVEAGAGYAIHYDVAGQRSPGTSVIDVGLGARFTDCSGGSDGAIELGAHLRMGVEGTRIDDVLYLTVGYEYAGGTPMFGRSERAHCGQSEGFDETPQNVTPVHVTPVHDPARPLRAPDGTSGEVDVVVPTVPFPPPPPPGVILEVPGPPTIIVPGPPPPHTPRPPSTTVIVPAPGDPYPPSGPVIVIQPQPDR